MSGVDPLAAAAIALASLLAGAILGALLGRRGPVAALGHAREELADVRRRLDAVTAELEARLAVAAETARRSEDVRRELSATFAELSREALKDNAELFVRQAAPELERRKDAVASLVAPLREELERLRARTGELEARRESAYGTLRQQVEQLQASTGELGRRAHELALALKGDHAARGAWGEVSLRNCVELAGLSRRCDFDEQVGVEGGRIDMVVRLPGGEGRIPVDAKVPLDAYMAAAEAAEEPARRRLLADHARAVRSHVKELSRRGYPALLGDGIDFTVLFMPSDAFLAAACEADADLHVDAIERRVLLATPVTLLALLRTVALTWRQSALAEDARLAWEAGRELHARARAFATHLARVGGGLETALSSYNRAVGAWQARVLPQGRRLEELQVPGAGDEPWPELSGVDGAPRAVPADEPAAGVGSQPADEPAGSSAADRPDAGRVGAPTAVPAARRQPR